MNNEFKESLKTDTVKGKETMSKKYVTKEIDKKISYNIVKTLNDMIENTTDPNEKKQILDRMLNINQLFEKGFDEEIEKLINSEYSR